jgi:hypothetical protein
MAGVKAHRESLSRMDSPLVIIIIIIFIIIFVGRNMRLRLQSRVVDIWVLRRLPPSQLISTRTVVILLPLTLLLNVVCMHFVFGEIINWVEVGLSKSPDTHNG